MFLSFASTLISFFTDRIQKYKKHASCSHTEYCVYTIDRHKKGEASPFRWQKRHTTSIFKKALARAQILYKSGDFERVEIRKLVRDDYNNLCSVYEGYRIFEDKKHLLW